MLFKHVNVSSFCASKWERGRERQKEEENVGEADGDVIKTGEVPFPGVCVSAHRGCLVNSSDKSLIVS